MTNESLRFEEELLLAAAEMPVLSAGLRNRVLHAAVTTERRRSYGRRALSIAGVLFACLGLTAWQGPLILVGQELVGLGGSNAAPADESYDATRPLINVSGRYGRGELLLSAAGDDWRMVEAEAQSRHEGYRRLVMSF
ncbi:MAG: hypothetical protein EXS05_06015 [Planctomycetaceae bacterium]|nr:hypothetical protein [Planctomycetaceae bacterium]